MLGLLLLGPAATAVHAEDEVGLEEVIVTAQRTAESIQDVPIAVTALTGSMLEDKQVITVSDLQMNAPNVSFTPTNFGSNSFSIRGIGRLVTAATGDAGVSIHTNEIAVGPNLNTAEFYDMERVEVLRGPQGTLYGRNATGGVVNLVTKMPDFDGVSGFIDFEYADYDNTRFKGAFNLPVTDNFALRFAGMKLDRDGYTKNLASGQIGLDGRTLDGIDDDVDGRDILDFRITALWQINDQAELWLQYNRYDEDDDRARITNQVCVQADLPLYGCNPDEVGFETPHASATLGGVIAQLYQLAPQGNPGITGNYNWPRPALGLREMHTDFEPVFKNETNTFTGGFTYEFENLTLGIVGGYAESEFFTRQDYNMNVDAELGFNFYTGSFFYPISEPAGGPGDDWRPGPCNLPDGTSGIPGGCLYGEDLTRAFTFDQSDSDSEYWTVEVKLQSNFDGRFNFLVGGVAFDYEAHGDYYVQANLLDARPDSYPGYFNATGDPDGATFSEGWAVFGEMYFDLTDSIKLTAGLRYNEDKKKVRDTSVLWNATDINFPLSTWVTALSGLPPFLLPQNFTRLPGFLSGGAPSDAELALINYYGQGGALDAALATGAQSPERQAISDAVGLVPGFNEARALTGSPDTFKWDEITGRIGIDWQINDNSMLYFFYSRGYKPGGANPPIPTDFQGESNFDFASEKIDSFEVGMKNILLDGQMVLNGAFFAYDYQGLQVARIKNNTSLNENIDADIMGFEAEFFFRPDALPGLQIDAAYSWLDTEVKDTFSVDPTNREGGDPDWITMNTIGFLYAAKREDITPLTLAIGEALGCSFPGFGTHPAGTPGIPDGTPVVFDRGCIGALGVETVEGVPVDLDGNSLPNSPEHTIHLGIAYTWNVAALAGDLTLRWDYYWQDDSYAREFNTIGDEIDSWDQHNASIIYESSSGRWEARAWIRNIGDEDNITGHYLTSDTSGYFRNYFVTEPRIYGASLRFNFGG